MLSKFSSLREINWSQNWRWDIQFPTAPSPFNEWFPATDVDENIFTLNTKDFNSGMSTYSLPKDSTQFDLKVTWIDDMALTLEHWLEHWVNSKIMILKNGGTCLRPLKSIVKEVHLHKLDSMNEIVASHKFLVYPKDSLYFEGRSEAGRHGSQTVFVIAGTISKKRLRSHANYRM